MKDLIERLRNDTYMEDEVRANAHEAANALERLTAGDVGMLEPCVPERGWFERDCYILRYAKEYGDRRAAAAVLAERERCAKVCDETVDFFNGSNMELLHPLHKREIETAEGMATAIRK